MKKVPIFAPMKLPDNISECHEIIKQQHALIQALVAQVVELTARVSELENQLKQNSKNSSRPPSTDWKKSKPAFPRKKGKVGGKSGHKGGTLKMDSAPDKVVEHAPTECNFCGKERFQEPLNVHARRQVFDIPEPRIEITEHQVCTWACCGCQKENKGSFPTNVTSQTQYGPRISALSVVLDNRCSMPRGKISTLFKDLYGININGSTLQSFQNRAHEALQKEEEYIQSQVKSAKVVYADETGIPVSGGKSWLHVASTEFFTMLFVHEKRGRQAHFGDESISILSSFQNWLVHDCWATYFGFDKCKHALCMAHILRELQAQIEIGSKWAKQMKSHLFDLYEKTEKGVSKLETPERRVAKAIFRSILKKADREEPPPKQGARGKPKKSKGRNLYERLEKHEKAALAFIHHSFVPFTNNQGERDIRPAKTKAKVSGCFRTFHGAESYARVQSFISTVHKHNFNPFKELTRVFEGLQPEYRMTEAK